jgi:hypothetical protein
VRSVETTMTRDTTVGGFVRYVATWSALRTLWADGTAARMLADFTDRRAAAAVAGAGAGAVAA